MGQKVNPIGFRLGINRTWDSRWFADGAEYAKLLHEDFRSVSTCVKRTSSRPASPRSSSSVRTRSAASRSTRLVRVCHRQEGCGHREPAPRVSKMTDSEVHLNIVEVRKPEIDATWLRQSIAQQLERRIAFRRAMKRAVQSAMRWVPRVSGSPAAAVSAVRKSPVPNGTVKAVCRCTRCAPMSITAPRSAHRLRHQRHQGLDLQG
jgi:small subunit ribosomal protein S3